MTVLVLTGVRCAEKGNCVVAEEHFPEKDSLLFIVDKCSRSRNPVGDNWSWLERQELVGAAEAGGLMEMD